MTIQAVDFNGNPITATPVYDACLAPVSVALNSGSAAGASGATVATPAQGFDGVMLSIVVAGTITAGHITFEAYDGAAWLPVKGYPLESYNSFQGYALLTGLNNGLQFDVSGLLSFRARLDTAIVGGGSATITIIASSAPVVPGVVVGVDPTATANNVGTNSFATAQITVSTSAVPLVAARRGNAGSGSAQAGVGRVGVIITNTGATAIFVGASGVTATTGLPILPNASSPLLPTTAAIYAIADAGSNAVGVFEVF